MGVTNRVYFRNLFDDEGVTEDRDRAFVYINEITFLVLTKAYIFLHHNEGFDSIKITDYVIHKKYKCSKKRILAARSLLAIMTNKW